MCLGFGSNLLKLFVSEAIAGTLENDSIQPVKVTLERFGVHPRGLRDLNRYFLEPRAGAAYCSFKRRTARRQRPRRCSAKFIVTSRKEGEEYILRKGLHFPACAALFCLGEAAGRITADLRKAIIRKDGFDLLLAIKNRVDLAMLLSARVVGIERLIDGAENDMKRDSGVLPTFDQRPVHRRNQQRLPPPPDKLLLDFREIIEIVQPFRRIGAVVGVDTFQG